MSRMHASRLVVGALAEQENWPTVWAYYGRKNIYASDLFLPQHDSTYEVTSCKSTETVACHHVGWFLGCRDSMYACCGMAALL